MRGSDDRTGELFSYVDLEARVRTDHPLRMIRAIVNEALASLEREFAALYSPIGRPSIPPEKLLRAMLLQAFYSIRSERQLMERLEFDLLFRWFVGLGVDDPAWDHSVFSKNRDRLLEGDIAVKFLAAVLAQPRVKKLLSTDHFSVDGTLIEAWASMKSFKSRDCSEEPPAGGGRNNEANFHGRKRSNETHASTTDPDAKLYRKGPGKEAKLCFMGHGLMENRFGLLVRTCLTPANGHAERVAALDLVSGGRVEFGMGESASITELEPFDRNFAEKRAVWEDAVRAVIPMFREGGCEYHGTYFDFPLRNVVPKPLQKPHPPLWVACSQLDTIEMAGRRGLGALAFQFLSADAAHAWVHAYYNSFTKRLDKLTDYVTNPNIALTSYFMCAETDEEARRRADGIPFFQFALRFYGQSALRKRPDPGTVNLWDEYEKWKRENPDGLARALSGGLIGSPETLRRKLRRFQTSHIDQVILLNQAGKNTHAHICESLELFAREVMPEFHARIPEQEAWKRQVLAREIELEEIDTVPFRERYGPNSVQVSPAQAAE